MKIYLSKQLHQDNLKVEIYHQFRIKFVNEKIDLLCEYRLSNCRFDMVAYETDSNEILGLIEVRRIGVKRVPKFKGNKHLKYSQFGCEIFYISQFCEIQNLLTHLENRLVVTKIIENVF